MVQRSTSLTQTEWTPGDIQTFGMCEVRTSDKQSMIWIRPTAALFLNDRNPNQNGLPNAPCLRSAGICKDSCLLLKPLCHLTKLSLIDSATCDKKCVPDCIEAVLSRGLHREDKPVVPIKATTAKFFRNIYVSAFSRLSPGTHINTVASVTSTTATPSSAKSKATASGSSERRRFQSNNRTVIPV